MSLQLLPNGMAGFDILVDNSANRLPCPPAKIMAIHSFLNKKTTILKINNLSH